MNKIRGVTLIELVIVITLIGTLSVVCIDMTLNFFQLNFQQQALSDLIAQGRYGMLRMTNDFASVTSVSGCQVGGSSGITVAGYDNSPITYSLNSVESGILTRNGTPLVDHVSEFTVKCLNNSGIAVDDDTQAHYLWFEMGLLKEKLAHQLTTAIYLRNL